MNSTCIALIAARGGSKGLPGKNIISINGKPLIEWTIKAALDCSLVGRVFVSTDDKDIARISVAAGAEVIDRPAELATDTASSVDVIVHAIAWCRERQISADDMVLLQPTSPLRNACHLQEALTFYWQHNAHAVISVFEPAQTPMKSYVEQPDGSIQGLFSPEAPYLRRQDLPRAFQPNGAIYAFSTQAFSMNNHFPREKVFPYLMSEQDSVDIDRAEDLLIAEKRMKELNV